MVEYETHDFDVVIIGAGGAGLRAAIEAQSKGLRTALVCKSLLGKAHTVMAEGGVAAALGNVSDEDNWKVHFRDTMRGGKMLNNWRMAQLHAQESPDRVRELEDWGALFDRTKDGLILQRDFGGHRFARLAHVGDRTGLELIRTLQQRAVAAGIEVFMELKVLRLLHDAEGTVSGLVGYWRPSGEFVTFTAKAVVMATGGIGKSWMYTSNSWESTGDGHAMSLWAGADLIDMECVQFHPTGMVWPLSVRGLLVTVESCGTRRATGSCSTTSPRCSRTRRPTRRTRPTVGTTTSPPAGGRPSCSPATRWPGPSTARSRPAGGAPMVGSSSTSPPGGLPRTSGVGFRRCTTSSRSWPGLTSPPKRWRWARPATTRWVASGWMPTRRQRRSPGCSLPARWPVACTGPTDSAATPSPTCWCSGAVPASGPLSSPRAAAGRPPSTRGRSMQPLPRPLRPSSARAAKIPTTSTRTCKRPCRAWSASSGPDPSSKRHWARSKCSRRGPTRCQ